MFGKTSQALFVIFVLGFVNLGGKTLSAQTERDVFNHIPQPKTSSLQNRATGFAPTNQQTFRRENTAVNFPETPLRKTSRIITPSKKSSQSAGSKTSGYSGAKNSFWTTVGSLLFVIGLILVGAKVLKKHGPIKSPGLPTEALEVLGKRQLDQRQAIHFLRCGSRILIVGSTPDGLNTLSEVTDPVEVDYLAGVCNRNETESGVGQAFKPLLNKYLFASREVEKKKPSVSAFRTKRAETNLAQTNLLARQSLQAAQETTESDREIHYE